MVRGIGAIAGSGLWTIKGSSYVPGTLALIGSPCPDVLKMMNCALSFAPHGGGTDASARRGSRRSDAGRPVASARSPTRPVPKSVERRAFRRVIMFAFS
jgi:hypothetical protein